MDLVIDISGFSQLANSMLDGALNSAAQAAVEDSGALLFNRIRTNFLDQKAPDGTFWEPSFAAFQRSFNGRGGGTLFDTGTLYHSIQLYSVSPYERSIGTNVPYGRFHNEGTAILPKREFLGWAKQDEELALKVFIKRISEAFQ
jgi:phage gpG-like protein